MTGTVRACRRRGTDRLEEAGGGPMGHGEGFNLILKAMGITGGV